MYSSSVLVVALVILVFGALLLRRKARGLSLDECAMERATELQAFLTARVEDLRQLFAKEHLGPEARREEAYAILAQMESRNVGGNLDAFIQDNREAVEDELRAMERKT